jgi:phospholipase/carboxylesterase
MRNLISRGPPAGVWNSPASLLILALLLGATACHSAIQSNPDTAWGGLEHRKAGAGLARAELIIVLLHGYGSREDNLVGLASMIDSGVATGYIFPAAPIDLGSGRRGWNLPDGTGFDASRNQVLDLLAYIQQAYPQADVVVGGFSQGGTLAISLLAEDLPKVEGYLFFSPGWFLSHEPRQGSGLPPIFLSHGEKDTILPFSGSEALREYLGESGYAVTWKQFDGGHTIPATVITSANLFLAGLMK